jgi:hypothetical protein
MRRTILSIALTASLIGLSAPSMAAGLDSLEPVTRMIEVCDMAVSDRIAKETDYKRVDRVVAAAAADTVAKGDLVNAPGAAFRDRGHWYGLRYSCSLDPDHTKARNLRYAVGHEIPESAWEQYGLWR